jgi:hypothetical protein
MFNVQNVAFSFLVDEEALNSMNFACILRQL